MSRTIKLKKGLTKKEAWKQARKRPGPDFRGMKYNKRTGLAKLV